MSTEPELSVELADELADLRRAHHGLKQSYKNLHKTLTLKDHIIKTREWERDEALRECGGMAKTLFAMQYPEMARLGGLTND